jgi:hypothetical protein
MENITLTPEAVNAYKELITNPKKHGLTMLSLEEVFEDTEEATAKHILFNEYLKKVNHQLPKVFFYIIMDEIYSNKIAKANDGNLGYKLKFSELANSHALAKIHSNEYSGDAPFICSKCKKEFENSNELDAHWNEPCN